MIKSRKCLKKDSELSKAICWKFSNFPGRKFRDETCVLSRCDESSFRMRDNVISSSVRTSVASVRGHFVRVVMVCRLRLMALAATVPFSGQ